MKDRFMMLATILGFVLIGIPLMLVAYIVLFMTAILTPLDIPVWLVTGRTPICGVFNFLNEKLE